METRRVEMNVKKRKSDECHYCANQKQNGRKKRKLTIPHEVTSTQNDIMVPVQGSFKCRGRGGKEIDFPTDNGTPSNKALGTECGFDAGINNGMKKRNHGYKPNVNFKLRPTSQSRRRRNPPKSEISRQGQASAINCRSASKTEMWLATTQTNHEFHYSAGELSSSSRKISKSPWEHRSDVRTTSSVPLLSSPSDGQSLTDESITTCLTRSRNIRKAVDICDQASRNSALPSTSWARKARSSRTATERSRSPHTSSSSVREYLNNVSKELQQGRLLGKLEQPKKLCRTVDRLDEKGDRLKGTVELRKFDSSHVDNPSEHRRAFQKSTKSTSTNQSSINAGRRRFKTAKIYKSLWSKMFNLFSLGCWKADDVNSTAPSVNRKSESTSTCESNDLISSESSSTSTGTTTVAACGRLGAEVGNDLRETRETLTTKTVSSQSSVSVNRKLMSVKLVESLKRFFSSQRRSDGCELSEANSISSSEDEISAPSSSAPLKTTKLLSSSTSKQPTLTEKSSAPKLQTQRIKSSPESEDSNRRLLLDPAASPLSTDNETSDAEILYICPMHKQPI